MNQLETEVLQLIGESTTSPDVFTDDSAGMAQIRDSLNDAIEEISMLSGAVQRKYHMLARFGQTFYRMDFRSDRFAWVTDAWLIDIKRRLEQTDLIKVTSFNDRWLVNTGNPEAYGQIGPDVIFYWPQPAADIVVELTCCVIPERYANDYDRVKVRAMFQSAAVRFAVGEYYASRGDAQQAVYHHTKYMEVLQGAGIYPKAYERPYWYRTEKTREAVTG